MSKNPKTISEKELAVDALNVMEEFKITHIFVSDPLAEIKDGKIKPTGILHIHNILGAKII